MITVCTLVGAKRKTFEEQNLSAFQAPAGDMDPWTSGLSAKDVSDQETWRKWAVEEDKWGAFE